MFPKTRLLLPTEERIYSRINQFSFRVLLKFKQKWQQFKRLLQAANQGGPFRLAFRYFLHANLPPLPCVGDRLAGYTVGLCRFISTSGPEL